MAKKKLVAGLGGSAGVNAQPGMLDPARSGISGSSTNKANKGIDKMLPFPNQIGVDPLLPPKGSRDSGGGSSSYGGGYGGGGGGGGGGGSAAPAKSSREEARAVLYAGLASILGRKPTKAEVDAYLTALNVQEGKAPGMSADLKGQFTSDWIDEDPDLKAERRGYETATKYFDAFTKAIQSPVSI